MNVLTFPAGKTYDLIAKYDIYCHPIKVGYPQSIDTPVAFRQTGGLITEIYQVAGVIDFDPLNYKNALPTLSGEERKRALEYIEERYLGIGFTRATNYRYRLYFLKKIRTLNPAHVMKPNPQGRKYVDLED